MIIKGQPRSTPKQLARLMLEPDPELAVTRVEILEHISMRDDIAATLRDWEIIGQGTRGKKFFYHASINPAEGYPLTTEQWLRSANVLQDELTLTNQPRVLVLHESPHRAWLHAAWTRTRVETMTLIPHPWNYRAHERASRILELEFGHPETTSWRRKPNYTPAKAKDEHNP